MEGVAVEAKTVGRGLRGDFPRRQASAPKRSMAVPVGAMAAKAVRVATRQSIDSGSFNFARR